MNLFMAKNNRLKISQKHDLPTQNCFLFGLFHFRFIPILQACLSLPV